MMTGYRVGSEDERWENGTRWVERTARVEGTFILLYLHKDLHLIELNSANSDYAKCFQKYEAQ